MTMTNVYNGEPSITLTNKPFFSIIIPCYNSGKTLPALLDSIVAQNMDDEIEVILSDDHSTESYQDVVERYNQTLSIRQVQTDYNFAPGNTREKGVQYATGEWVTFADHDDEYIPNTLRQVKDLIIERNERLFVIADFYELNPETREIIQKLEHTGNWMHAKFYNLENLWKKHDIHFKKDLLTHEDICVSSQIICAIEKEGSAPTFTDFPVYNWIANPKSISREKYGDHSFLETFFRDYIESTGYTYYDILQKGDVDPDFIYYSMVEVLLYCYFYMQGIKFQQGDNWLRDNEQHCRDYYILIKQTFNATNNDVCSYVASNNCEMYLRVRESAFIGIGKFFEIEGFPQFLDRLHRDIERPKTMTQVMEESNKENKSLEPLNEVKE